MKLNKSATVWTAIAAAFMLTACQETDLEAPAICTDLSVSNSVLADEIEALAGSTVTIEDVFCDNAGLSEVRWDVHNAADHAHEEGEESEGLILHSGEDWEVLEIQSLSGTSAAQALSVAIPLSARGVWDVVVSLVDAEGNAATDAITQLHIENEFIPAFAIAEVDGVDPAQWGDEPVWSAGSTIAITGSVSDSDGLASATLALVEESSEAVLWEVDLAVEGLNDLTFDVDVMVPTGVAGECHFEMQAEDAMGNAMETGFHVEVE